MRRQPAWEIPIYPDRGCTLAPACLTCPLPDCMEGKEHQAQVDARDREIGPLVLQLEASEASRRYGLSLRTIYRIRQKARIGP